MAEHLLNWASVDIIHSALDEIHLSFALHDFSTKPVDNKNGPGHLTLYRNPTPSPFYNAAVDFLKKHDWVIIVNDQKTLSEESFSSNNADISVTIGGQSIESNIVAVAVSHAAPEQSSSTDHRTVESGAASVEFMEIGESISSSSIALVPDSLDAVTLSTNDADTASSTPYNPSASFVPSGDNEVQDEAVVPSDTMVIAGTFVKGSADVEKLPSPTPQFSSIDMEELAPQTNGNSCSMVENIHVGLIGQLNDASSLPDAIIYEEVVASGLNSNLVSAANEDAQTRSSPEAKANDSSAAGVAFSSTLNGTYSLVLASSEQSSSFEMVGTGSAITSEFTNLEKADTEIRISQDKGDEPIQISHFNGHEENEVSQGIVNDFLVDSRSNTRSLGIPEIPEYMASMAREFDARYGSVDFPARGKNTPTDLDANSSSASSSYPTHETVSHGIDAENELSHQSPGIIVTESRGETIKSSENIPGEDFTLPLKRPFEYDQNEFNSNKSR